LADRTFPRNPENPPFRKPFFYPCFSPTILDLKFRRKELHFGGKLVR
jgi:hypothetical protein